MTEPDFILEWLGGNCPVQAQGTYRGKRFYFRSRGNRWAFYIGTDRPYDNPDWQYSEPYGDEPFVAGWITDEEAMGFIEQSIRQYDNR